MNLKTIWIYEFERSLARSLDPSASPRQTLHSMRKRAARAPTAMP